MKKFVFLFVCLFVNSVNAATIGQWSESSRSWNNSFFSTIKSTLIGAGHTVESDAALITSNLVNDDLFVIAEATRGLTISESTDLLNWVTGGGILWLGVDSDSNVSFSNTILTNLGSGMSFSAASSGSGSPLVGGNFATNNIFDIVGQSLTLSLGKSVLLGGTGSFISDNILGFEQIGSGYVFAAGDRFEHNFSNSTNTSTNGQLILNIAAAATPVPVPAAVWLFGSGIIGLIVRRKKSSKASALPTLQ